MPDFDIRSESGEQLTIGGQITKPATAGAPPPWPNYPSNAAGFALVFSAKRRKDDAAPLVRHDNNPGTVAGDSFTAGGAQLFNGGAWTITLVKADTSAFTRTEELAYDVALIEPDGTRTVVSKGRWVVEKSVGL